MKSVTATKAELDSLQAVDAKLGGLPIAGRIWPPGGSARLGDGVTTWTGWTRYRYDVDAKGLAYPVDEALEESVAKAAPNGIPKAQLDAAKALVAKATVVAGAAQKAEAK